MLLALFPILYTCTALYLKEVTTQGCLLTNLLKTSLPKIHVCISSPSLGQLISTNLQGPMDTSLAADWAPVKMKFFYSILLLAQPKGASLFGLGLGFEVI